MSHHDAPPRRACEVVERSLSIGAASQLRRVSATADVHARQQIARRFGEWRDISVRGRAREASVRGVRPAPPALDEGEDALQLAPYSGYA